MLLKYKSVSFNFHPAGWFSRTDCYRFGFSRQYYLDTKLGCGCLLWKVQGNLDHIKLELSSNISGIDWHFGKYFSFFVRFEDPYNSQICAFDDPQPRDGHLSIAQILEVGGYRHNYTNQFLLYIDIVLIIQLKVLKDFILALIRTKLGCFFVFFSCVHFFFQTKLPFDLLNKEPTFSLVSLDSCVLPLFLSQDVLLICCTPDWISQNHVLASCRMVLRSQNILGLNRAPCLAVFLERLPLLLQDQYSYERVSTETKY